MHAERAVPLWEQFPDFLTQQRAVGHIGENQAAAVRLRDNAGISLPENAAGFVQQHLIDIDSFQVHTILLWFMRFGFI